MKPSHRLRPAETKDDIDALSDAAEQYVEFRIINQSIKDLKDKVELLQGSRNRSKRRFHFFKGDVDARQAALEKKYDELSKGPEEGLTRDEVLEREIRQRKADFDQMMLELEQKFKAATKEAQESMETRKNEHVQEFRNIIAEADDAIKAKMDTLNSALEATLLVMSETRSVLESHKRKRDEDEDTDASITFQPAESAPPRPLKRRRLPIVAAPVLAGAAMIYLGLGFLDV